MSFYSVLVLICSNACETQKDTVVLIKHDIYHWTEASWSGGCIISQRM